MKYRILQVEEWSKLFDLVDSTQHHLIPHPNCASVAVAEDDEGNIVGCLFLQLALHMEPLILQSPEVRFDKLHDTLLDELKDKSGLHVYVFSDKEIVDRMALHVGMNPLPFKVFEQVVK